MTRHISSGLFLCIFIAAAAFLLVPVGASAAGGTVTCASTLTGSVDANVDVPAGAVCADIGFEITGNVTVEGTLVSLHGTYDGNVIVDGGRLDFTFCMRLICPPGSGGGSRVAGNLLIDNSPSENDVLATRVDKNVAIEGNSGPVALAEDNVSGNINVADNTGQVTIFATVVGKNVNCDGNSPPPQFVPMFPPPEHASGQCAQP